MVISAHTTRKIAIFFRFSSLQQTSCFTHFKEKARITSFSFELHFSAFSVQCYRYDWNYILSFMWERHAQNELKEVLENYCPIDLKLKRFKFQQIKSTQKRSRIIKVKFRCPKLAEFIIDLLRFSTESIVRLILLFSKVYRSIARDNWLEKGVKFVGDSHQQTNRDHWFYYLIAFAIYLTGYYYAFSLLFISCVRRSRVILICGQR